MNQTLLETNANWESHINILQEKSTVYLGIRKLNIPDVKCFASQKTIGGKCNVLGIIDACVLTLYQFKSKTAFWWEEAIVTKSTSVSAGKSSVSDFRKEKE